MRGGGQLESPLSANKDERLRDARGENRLGIFRGDHLITTVVASRFYRGCPGYWNYGPALTYDGRNGVLKPYQTTRAPLPKLGLGLNRTNGQSMTRALETGRRGVSLMRTTKIACRKT